MIIQFQVDCAILLCLFGGWPASAACAHARVAFIRRITPWPTEPHLKIGRCPMGMSFNDPAPQPPMERFYEISYRDTPSISLPTEVLPFVPMQPDEKDAIDISGDAFDFVRSIRVRQIQVGKCENREGDCNRSDSTGLGSYGAHGDYRWAPSDVDQVPPASQMAFRTAALTGPCPCNTAPESVHTTTEKKRRQTVKPDALLE